MPEAAERELLSVDGREIAISNPRKILFPAAGYTKLDLARYYIAVAAGCAAGRGWKAQCTRAISQRHCRRILLSEACAGIAALIGSKSYRCAFHPDEVPRKSCRETRRHWYGWRTLRASNCIRIRYVPMISIIPDELRVDLDPVPGVPWTQVREVARVAQATLQDFGLIGLAEDVGIARHARLRADRASMDVR